MGAEKVLFDYYDEFEEAYRTDCWEAVVGRFAEGATYTISGLQWAAELRGAAAIVDGMRRSLSGFDRQFDSRHLAFLGRPTEEGSRVTARLLGVWCNAGQEALVLPVTTRLTTEGDRIRHLEDIYDPAALAPALDWMARHGQGLDPSYVDRTEKD